LKTLENQKATEFFAVPQNCWHYPTNDQFTLILDTINYLQ